MLYVYKGFMIGEEPIGNWRAYRNEQFLNDMLPTFVELSQDELTKKIDESGDYGEFTEEQVLAYGQTPPGIIMLRTENGAKSIEEQIAEQIHKLPFMPEPGPPLPKYVQEALGTQGLAVPVSAYGRALSDYVLEKLTEFLGNNFVVAEDFDETGWASDSVIYEGIIRHVPTNTEWWVEIMASFEWRKPEKIDTVDINFMSFREVGGGDNWNNCPEEIADTSKWIFDLAADEGIRASEMVSKFREMGW